MKKEATPTHVAVTGYANLLPSKVLEALEVAHNWQSSLLDNFFKQYQLSRQQYNILCILYNNQHIEVSINDIKRNMIDEMSNVSRLVEKLYKKSLVHRSESNIDRRVTLVTLTAQGVKLLNQITQTLPDFLARFDTLSEAEALQLITLLEQFKKE
jgi:DNA-binding MarR family transcriptional regulator